MDKLTVEKAGLALSLALILTVLYVQGAVRHGRMVNTNMHATDQSAYMDITRRMVASNYSYLGDRNRMPLYPFWQSLFYDPGMSDETFFERGKRANIFLSLILLPPIFLIFRAHFPLFHTLNVTLVTSFTVFMFKAPYIQAELLFYFLSFVAFVMLLRLLLRPAWWGATASGVVLGLAYLTKASVLPGLLLFCCLALFQAGRIIVRDWQRPSIKVLAPYLVSAPLVTFFFLLTISPYIIQSKRIFGQYFYNVNSTFYMWYDSWHEVEQGTRAQGDREGWPAMPAELIPGPAKYLREHTLGQIGSRLSQGLLIVLVAGIKSYGYYKYMLIFLVFIAMAVTANWPPEAAVVKQYLEPILFVAGYFAAYLLLYAWYTPIAGGNRFTLALFLPFLFVVSCLIRRYHDQLPTIIIATKRIQLVNLLVLSVLVVDLYLILTSRIVTVYAGS